MKPEIITRSAEMARWVKQHCATGKTLGLVPTMGALHAGHLGLVTAAARASNVVVVSIFVNPTQFGPTEDLAAYPRTLEADIHALTEQGQTAVIFAPGVQDMYPTSRNKTWVTVDELGEFLCGASRPGHFRGVTTIVARLFAIIQPDYAFFGLKDAQQFFILQRMSQEMGFQTELIGVPTIRESDGLAMSSRNQYLNEVERAAAVVLSKAVERARELIQGEGQRDVDTVLQAMVHELEEAPMGKIDYTQIVDVETLHPVELLSSGMRVLAAVAFYFGKARLIDNSIVDVP